MKGYYKEIWYGVAIGVSVWILDALMHANLRGRVGLSALAKELIETDSPEFAFRVLFVCVSTALGVSLWRSNQRRCEVEELQAVIGAFHRQIINPAVLIVGYSRMLSLREGWPVGHESVEIINEIQSNAQKLNNALKCLPPPYEPAEESLMGGARTTQESHES